MCLLLARLACGHGSGPREIPAEFPGTLQPRGTRAFDVRQKLTRLTENLETSVWLIPAFYMAGAVALSLGLESVDDLLPDNQNVWFMFRGGPEGARSLLAAVAGSLMSLAGVVFSVSILVMQLASNQFSPRVLRHFLRDRGSQSVLGIFMGAFMYALLAMRTVRGSSEGAEQHVPALTVWFSVVLAAATVASFIYFIHHVAQSIRAVNVLHRIGAEARAHLARIYSKALDDPEQEPRASTPEGPPSLVVLFEGPSGVLISIDEEALAVEAERGGVVLRVVPMLGDFLPHQSPLLEVWGERAGDLDRESLNQAAAVGRERSMRQDVLFAVRELVDVAERALSPGVNDPTTAVQALDEVHDLLRRLVDRRFPNPCRYNERGQLRLILPRPDWDAYVRLAIDEVRHYGEGSIQVARRLRFLIEDLLRIAPDSRRGELLVQLSMLEHSVGRSFGEERDRALANRPCRQGHGPE
jgi:uncharacterized membrane protein